MHIPSLKTLSLLTGFGLVLGIAVPAGAQGTTPSAPPPPAPAPLLEAGDSVPVMSGDYQLAPDDQINIAVEGYPQFDKDVVVLPNGTFSYLGHTIRASGLTQDVLTQSLTRALKGQLRYRPLVTVSVRQAHIRQVSVLGAARVPGKYQYLAGMHVIDVLADSGGPAQADELTDATLFTNNGATSQTVDLVKLMQGADPALNVPVQPGDVLFLQARNPATAMVLIRGQVGHEGQYAVRPEGATILAMLTQAGGMTPSAAYTRVQLTHNGQTRVLNLRPTLFDTTAPVGQTPIVAGDTVAVPLNNARYIVWGEVRNPSVYGLPDGEPTTVTKALALAGTPTPDADMKTLTVVRTGPDGKSTYIPVNEDNVVRNRRGGDIDLQDGDILIVPKRAHGGNTTGAAQGLLGGLFSISALSSLLRAGL